MRQAVGGDQTEAPDFSRRDELRGIVPPEHHEVGRIGHIAPRSAQRVDVTVTKRVAHTLVADERRVADDVVGLRPFGLARVDVAFQWPLGVFVRNRFAGDRMRFHRHAVPAADRNAAFVEHRFHSVPGEHRVAAFDVPEILEDRLRRQSAALRAEVPLQVADPQYQFGNRGSARVEFEAEKLMRVDGQTFGFEALLLSTKTRPENVHLIEHFAFEALHVFERDVEEV